MSTTSVNHADFQQKIQDIYNIHGKKQAIAKACGIVGAIVFWLFSFLVTYGALRYFDAQYLAEEQVFAEFTVLNDLCKPLMSAFQFGAQPWYIVLSICLAAIILVPFIINVLTAIIVSACYKKNMPAVPQDHPIGTLNALTGIAKDTTVSIKNSLEDRRLLITLLYLIPLGGLLVYGLFFAQPTADEMVMFAASLALCCSALYWVYRIPLNIFCALSKLLWKYDTKPADALISQLNSELSAAKKIEKEKAERKAAEEADALRKEGDELYKQATAGEEYDEALIKKAADMGSADACLYYGRQLMGQWGSGLLTREEKSACVKRAAKYLEFPAKKDTEAKFLWILARSQYENNTKSEWKAMLSDVRSIKASGELREEYEETCDILLKSLVGIIDRKL